MSARNNVVRIRHPGVEPLEIWQLYVDGAPVDECLGTRAVESMRRNGLAERDIGERLGELAVRFARRLRDGRYDTSRFVETQRDTARRVPGFDVVVFAGGLACIEGFRRTVSEAAPWCDVFESARPDAALRGAGRVLRARSSNPSAALVADVGQTAVKTAIWRADDGAAALESRRSFARPVHRIPVVLAEQRSSADSPDASIRFVADSLQRAMPSGKPRPEVLILALPCELDDDLTPGGCSYPGWQDCPDLVERIVQKVGLDTPETSVFVLNDAELAGFAVLDTLEREQTAGDALVVTLGFGPGGAYVNRGERDD